MSLTKLIDSTLLERFKNKIISLIPTHYADSPTAGGSAKFSNALHFAQVDDTSTATAFTATIPGITEYYDGLTIILKNGVVTSAAGFTININGLGAKQSYSNLAAATADTTLFNINYTMMFVYDSTRVSGGGWICYRGYDANTNTIGYQIRSNSYSLPATEKFYRYRLLFTSSDGAHFVPANTSSSTNATAARSVNQEKINPFGSIVYYGTTAAVNAGSRPNTAYLWTLYAINLGYSFNVSGGDLTLTPWEPVYLKCAPQADGSAIIDATTPIVQSLPSTDDGKIYIFLGVAYSATNIELLQDHPVYYCKNGVIRLWTNAPEAPVTSVNGNTGAVSLTASDVGAVDSAYVATAVRDGIAVYPIAFTPTAPDYSGTMTKSLAEIRAAYIADHRLVAISNDGANLFLQYVSNGRFYFQGIVRINDVDTLVTLITDTGSDPELVNTYTARMQPLYFLPSGGIPSTDLASGVQTSLGLADTALQSYTETDPTVPAWAKAANKPSYTASEVGAAPAVTEVTVSDAGAVTQALDAGKIYHFTGALTSLAITLNAAGTGQLSQYHFDFDSGSTAPTVTLPGTVTMQGGTFTPEASKHYEVDILNGYGVFAEW